MKRMVVAVGRGGALLAFIGLAAGLGAGARRCVELAVAYPPRLEAGGSARLVLIFHATDCANYRGMRELVSAVASDVGIPVEGVMLDTRDVTPESTRLMESLRLPFRVRLDERGLATRTLLALDLRHTPVALLVDAEGRPRLLAPPTRDERTLEALRESFRVYARTLMPGGLQ